MWGKKYIFKKSENNGYLNFCIKFQDFLACFLTCYQYNSIFKTYNLRKKIKHTKTTTYIIRKFLDLILHTSTLFLIFFLAPFIYLFEIPKITI